MSTLTVGTADLHLGDRGHMRRTWLSVRDKIVRLAGSNKPDQLTVVVDGDATAGRGMFRRQELANILQFGGEQVLVAAYKIAEFVHLLGEATGIPIEEIDVILLQGHHDTSNGENLGMQLAFILTVMGLKARFAGKSYQKKTRGNKHLLFQHGFGRSSYYPASYEELRETWKKANNLAIASDGGVVVERAIFAHSHWYMVDLAQGELAVDVLGGFVRPPEDKLNWGVSSRPTGAILYYVQGDELQAVGVEPDISIWREEMEDPDLYLDNLADLATTLKEVSAWARAKGMVP